MAEPIRVEVGNRWHATALLGRLRGCRRHLVQTGPGRWEVRIQAWEGDDHLADDLVRSLVSWASEQQRLGAHARVLADDAAVDPRR